MQPSRTRTRALIHRINSPEPLVGGDRHIRVALGRDYSDVPPTRGVYKGEAQSELSVSVTVSPADEVAPEPIVPVFVVRSRPVLARPAARVEQEQQQQ